MSRICNFYRIDENVIDPCLLDCVAQAVCGVNIDAARDTRSVAKPACFLHKYRFSL